MKPSPCDKEIDSPMTNNANSAAAPRSRTMAYWVTTVPVAAVLLVGGVTDILRTPYVRAVMEQLGYPAYFAVIIGVWKVPGAVTLLIPRFPRLKEWAYAGAVFNFTGAVASHLAVGDPAVTLVAPIIFTSLAAASWALRPPARRDLAPMPEKNSL
jgi:uncharacterized membrane protein YphA (DoxX/SURF4 family)